MKKIVKIVGVLFLLGVAASVFKGYDGKSPTKVASGDGGQAPAKAIPLPADEAVFVQIVQKGQQANTNAQNDMQKGGARANREKEICSALASLAVSDWVGEVNSVSSNSDGKGVLSVKVAPGVYVQTWNNAVSDVVHETLIEPSSALFAKASAFKEGQMVKFSGTFFREGDDSVGCLAESSLTLDGKLSEPEFIFRFSDASPS